MEKNLESINVEGGFFFGGWNFSKLVSVGSTFIREMRVSQVEYSDNTILTFGLIFAQRKPDFRSRIFFM